MEFIDVNVQNYVSDLVESSEQELLEYKKFARVKAEQGKVGQEIVTIMKDGLVETKNVVKEDPETGEPDWIVTNPNGEQYCVPDKTFKKKYELEVDSEGYHRPKGGAIKAIQITDNISFTAPWGEKMNIVKGGYLVVNNPNDIYGIQEEEFHNTYKLASEVDKDFNKDTKEIENIQKSKDEEISKN